MPKFYITTPIYYVNDKPHIGHTYTTIAADILARYHRIQGDDTFFLTGTDEHGAKVQEIAEKNKKTPKEFVDEISRKFLLAWKELGISYDNFIRTTDPHHEEEVKKVLDILYKNNYIYKGKYKALYCVGCEQYKTKSDLVDGKCPEHQKKCEIQEEEAYLFKLSSFQDELLKRIKDDNYKIRPFPRKNEVISFIEKQSLEDIAISRKKEKVSWGIELPFDKSHTAYVWIDAFWNYVSGLHAPNLKKDTKIFWPPDVQLMSKDILRVHATIWPALLLALKKELPRELFIHGYFTISGQKMSKSLGNVIDPLDIRKKYGNDALRYFLFSEISFGEDGDFSVERLEERYTSDLANGLGNLIQRVAVMIDKYFEGKIPKGDYRIDDKYYKKYIESLEFHKALDYIWTELKELDKLIDKRKPWDMAKNRDTKKLEELLGDIVSAVIKLNRLIAPFLPETSKKIAEIFSESGKVNIKKPLFPRREE